MNIVGVYVVAILNDKYYSTTAKEDKIIRGVFQGISNSVDGIMLFIRKINNSIDILNLEYYNILRISVIKTGINKTYVESAVIYSKISKTEQLEASNKLFSTLEQLADIEYTKKFPGMVNIFKFDLEAIKKLFLTAEDKKETDNKKTNFNIKHRPKKLTPFFSEGKIISQIKRTDPLPSANLLKEMFNKIYR